MVNTFFKTGDFARLSFWLQWIILIGVSLVLYLPVIDNSFVSDDFLVLKKLAVDRQLNLDNFFRPLSDITLYLTYKVFGLNPLPYYITGIMLHALSALLVFHYCLRWNLNTDTATQQRYALVAAALFITYPFHNESVAWILGRGALMANTLGLAALLMLTGHARRMYKIGVVCLCYFVGLAAYETIMPLPAMVLIYLALQKEEKRYIAVWTLCLAASFLLHVFIRIAVSGTFMGAYGSDFFNNNLLQYAGNAVKAIGRMILPPSDNVSLQIGLFGVLLLLVIVAMKFLFDLTRPNQPYRVFLLAHSCFFLLAMLVPVVAGVSTRTSESDRFLHFPSYFFCMLLAFALVQLIKDHTWQIAFFGVLIIYQVFFLEKNNRNWDKASIAVRVLMGIVEQGAGQKIVVVNLPDEIDGAFVFRNGLTDALLLKNIDTATVMVASRLTRDAALSLPPVIQHEQRDGRVFIPPSYFIDSAPDNTSRIVYWNKENWVNY